MFIKKILIYFKWLYAYRCGNDFQGEINRIKKYRALKAINLIFYSF